MKYLTLIAILLVTACASSVPQLKHYLLRSDALSQFAAEEPGSITGIGAIVVASYIDGLGIVLETAEGEVQEARNHQWAEPLRDSLRIFLAREISAASGQIIRFQTNREADWQQRIDVRIDELHGTVNGEASLVAYWTVSDLAGGAMISDNGFSDTGDLSRDGYEALVQAHKKLLRRLAAAIAATL